MGTGWRHGSRGSAGAGFLEGGVAWALNLYADLLGHFEKRNREAIGHYDPAALDRGLLEKLFHEHAPDALRDRLDRLDEGLRMLCDPDEDPAAIDEFAASGMNETELDTLLQSTLDAARRDRRAPEGA